MAEQMPQQSIQTPAATRAIAQTDEGSDLPSGDADFSRRPDEAFEIGDGVRRATRTAPHDHVPGEPVYRPLKIYTLDPAESRLDGAQAVVNVPYEPLTPGPVGGLFEVVGEGGDGGRLWVNLDDKEVLIANGRDAWPSDLQFHHQMVYAVCCTVYASFRKALGRQLHWGFGENDRQRVRLRVRPRVADLSANACYNKDARELQFGVHEATGPGTGRDRNAPGSTVYNCLSHDIVAHEVSHALLDGLRPHFCRPSNPDVLALHEAFGDLIAIFQHFSYRDVVLTAIARSRGRIEHGSLLTNLATQFGHTTGGTTSLRTAILPPAVDGQQPADVYNPEKEPHELGSVLVTAVFEAFITVYRRRTRDYIRLATNGTGELPPGDIPELLRRFLAEKASKLASQFLSICIRAIDYCPPMDVTFGDYLRAMITADYDLVPDDRWAFREALIDAFRARRIFPSHVPHLSEESLRWRAPDREINQVQRLSFRELKFRGDPGRPADAAELVEQARAIGRIATDPRYMDMFGLIAPDSMWLNGDHADLPWVESVRSSRRVGPDGQVLFDLIAEVAQRRLVRIPSPTGAGRDRVMEYFGGATAIIGPDGDVRYLIGKSVRDIKRAERQQEYALGPGIRYWRRDGLQLASRPNLFALLHRRPGSAK
jgi:hypothetical protein